MACSLQGPAETIDPALVSIWRQIAADAASPKTPLAAIMKDSLTVTKTRFAAPVLQVLSSPGPLQTIAQALRLYTPDQIYMSLNGGKDSRWAPPLAPYRKTFAN